MLEELSCDYVHIKTNMPELPDSLKKLSFTASPESIAELKQARVDEPKSMKRIHERNRTIKEGLLMSAYHPNRIEQLITKYGLDVLDNL
jgi:hypothetical protein